MQNKCKGCGVALPSKWDSDVCSHSECKSHSKFYKPHAGGGSFPWDRDEWAEWEAEE